MIKKLDDGGVFGTPQRSRTDGLVAHCTPERNPMPSAPTRNKRASISIMDTDQDTQLIEWTPFPRFNDIITKDASFLMSMHASSVMYISSRAAESAKFLERILKKTGRRVMLIDSEILCLDSSDYWSLLELNIDSKTSDVPKFVLNNLYTTITGLNSVDTIELDKVSDFLLALQLKQALKTSLQPVVIVTGMHNLANQFTNLHDLLTRLRDMLKVLGVPLPKIVDVTDDTVTSLNQKQETVILQKSGWTSDSPFCVSVWLVVYLLTSPKLIRSIKSSIEELDHPDGYLVLWMICAEVVVDMCYPLWGPPTDRGTWDWYVQLSSLAVSHLSKNYEGEVALICDIPRLEKPTSTDDCEDCIVNISNLLQEYEVHKTLSELTRQYLHPIWDSYQGPNSNSMLLCPFNTPEPIKRVTRILRMGLKFQVACLASYLAAFSDPAMDKSLYQSLLLSSARQSKNKVRNNSCLKEGTVGQEKYIRKPFNMLRLHSLYSILVQSINHFLDEASEKELGRLDGGNSAKDMTEEIEELVKLGIITRCVKYEASTTISVAMPSGTFLKRKNLSSLNLRSSGTHPSWMYLQRGVAPYEPTSITMRPLAKESANESRLTAPSSLECDWVSTFLCNKSGRSPNDWTTDLSFNEIQEITASSSWGVRGLIGGRLSKPAELIR